MAGAVSRSFTRSAACGRGGGRRECRECERGQTSRRAADVRAPPAVPRFGAPVAPSMLRSSRFERSSHWRRTMAVRMEGRYLGELKVRLHHGPSGTEIMTVAPVDNHGDGSSFSPTDLCAVSLG